MHVAWNVMEGASIAWRELEGEGGGAFHTGTLPPSGQLFSGLRDCGAGAGALCPHSEGFLRARGGGQSDWGVLERVCTYRGVVAC